MQTFTLGAGLAALGFWLMIAAAILGGIWYDIRKRQDQQETLRRLIESGQPIEEALVEKLLILSEGRKQTLTEVKAWFKVTALLLFCLAPGLTILGWLVGALKPLLGVSALLIFLAVGFVVATRNIDRWYGEDDDTVPGQPTPQG